MPDYRFIKRLGAGQFGEVWQTEDRAFGEIRAVKVVPQNNIHNPTNFYHEPQTLKQLQHPNVVQVFDAGTLNDGRLYIAMEYLQLGSIEDLFGGSIVPLRTAVKLAIDICRGVEYIHNKKFVHRDIKPANALIDTNGNAKVSDFGLCTNVFGPGDASAAGYVLHIAPEVILEDIFTSKSDVYAIGMTLYRMLNGDAILPAIAGMDEVKDLIVAGQYPDRGNFQIFIPNRVRAIVKKSMSVDPDDRHSSARQLRHALEKLILPYDWREETVAGKTRWIGSSSEPVFQLTICSKSGAYEVVTERFYKGGKKVKVTNGCFLTSRSNKFWPKVKRVFEWINLGHHGNCPN